MKRLTTFTASRGYNVDHAVSFIFNFFACLLDLRLFHFAFRQVIEHVKATDHQTHLVTFVTDRDYGNDRVVSCMLCEMFL